MVAELVNAVPAALQVLATCLERHHGEPASTCCIGACTCLLYGGRSLCSKRTEHQSIMYRAARTVHSMHQETVVAVLLVATESTPC